jgi:hypothetical protein
MQEKIDYEIAQKMAYERQRLEPAEFIKELREGLRLVEGANERE